MSPQSETKTFARGGVHPGDFKDRTCDLPIQVSEPPAEVAVLMAQHIGAPAKPVVEPKDRVRKGQLIGEAQGFISANVHSPVSGTVKAVEQRIFSVTGGRATAVVIENDGNERWARKMNEQQDVASMDVDAMIEAVKECGVVGLGGATFPSHVKLRPPAETPVTDVFVNGAECEPYVTVDHRLMLEQTAQLVEGLRMVMHIVGAQNGYIAVEENKPDAIAALQEAASGESSISVVPLKVNYPQGSEQQIITAICGREVPSGGGLPSDVGALVHNVATVLAIRDAIRFRIPLIERAVTVTGDGIENPGNFVERIGTSVADILERQGVREGASQLVLGGPMMGIAQGVSEVPLIKGNNCLLLRRADVMPPQRDCIRCGRCVAHCPLGLTPGEMSIAMERHDWDAAEELNVLECKECGCCAYVCPANRRIVQMVKLTKTQLRKKLARQKSGG